jgi:hypothetical protein
MSSITPPWPVLYGGCLIITLFRYYLAFAHKTLALREAHPFMQPPKLLDQVRTIARLKHLSLRTEKAYWHHIKRFILFHNKQHPKDMREGEIRAYLSYLAIRRSCCCFNSERGIGRPPVSIQGCLEAGARSHRGR